jgi:ribosomal protein L11 methyltransferase
VTRTPPSPSIDAVAVPRLQKIVLEVADRDLARRIAGALQDLIEPAPDALTIFEQGSAAWRVESYYADAPEPRTLHGRLEAMLGAGVPPPRTEEVPDRDWVALSQAALPPVVAGRFTVYGSHDRGRVPQGPNAILIDAGEAFGTAHHATTFGCLAAIDALTRRCRFALMLDLGCGSGVLAIALARALPGAAIIATDLDAPSVAVARDNMRRNGVAARIATFAADGLDHPRLRGQGRFDLVVANILADPLVALARGLSRALVPGGTLVLSGLLTPQAPRVLAAYRAAGFVLRTHRRIEGWSTLVLMRRFRTATIAR